MITQEREHWRVVVGGSRGARERWPTRTYHSKSAARSRAAQIQQAHDLGVATIWLVKAEQDQTTLEGFACEECNTARVLRGDTPIKPTPKEVRITSGVRHHD